MRRKHEQDRWPELDGYHRATRETLLRRAAGKDLAAASISRRVALGMIALITVALWVGFSSMMCIVAFAIWAAFERTSWGWLAGIFACLIVLLCVAGVIYVPVIAVRTLRESWMRVHVLELHTSNRCAGCDYPKPAPASNLSVICPECGLVYPVLGTSRGPSPASPGAPA